MDDKKKISDLTKPSIDANDYKSGNKEDFKRFYFKDTEIFQKALDRNCFYFLGEKGTGKTALAYLLEIAPQTPPNNIQILAKLFSVGETQYSNFINMKQKGKMDYSDYKTIWINILLYLVADSIIEKYKKNEKLFVRIANGIRGKYSNLEKAMEMFHSCHRIPEMESIMELSDALTSSEKVGADAKPMNMEINRQRSSQIKTSQPEIKRALLDSEKQLRKSVGLMKLKSDIIISLDGLDMRPSSVSEDEYSRCINGLAEAARELNQDFFPSINDSPGRIRIVLLLRPDIFKNLPIQNSNCAIHDNSVFLHWESMYGDGRYKESDLYRMVDRYFRVQNSEKYGWDEYFLDDSSSSAFKFLLNHSFHRPRDFFFAIRTLASIKSRNKNATSFNMKDLDNPNFRRAFSNYLLGEVRNYATYYISNKDFDGYITFFGYLNGKSTFSYKDFTKAFSKFRKDVRNEELEEKYLKHPDDFLQFLFDMRIIGYRESQDDKFVHWFHREQSEAMLKHRIPAEMHYQYEVHLGLINALNLSKKIKQF